MAWVDDFLQKTPEQRLAEIGTINDLLRDLRESTFAAMNAQTAITQSERNFAAGWRNTLVTDIDTGIQGQNPGVKQYAEALKNHFA